VYIFGLFEIIM